MPTTGVTLIPPGPGNTSSAPKLIAHLSRAYPTQEHHSFSLEHRLFSDTSSQLPGADVKQRSFTHILTLSHDPQHAFVTTTKAGEQDESSSIVIPASSVDSFMGLIMTKMQPFWYPRQMLTMENGVCVVIEKMNVIVCIGDVKVSTRSGATSTLRGTVVELFREEDPTGASSEYTEEDANNDRFWFRSALAEVFKPENFSFDGSHILTGRTQDRQMPVDVRDKQARKMATDWELAKLYMRLLRK